MTDKATDIRQSQKTAGFWSLSAADLLSQLQTTAQGLSDDEARLRLARYGANHLNAQKRAPALKLLLAQFQSPIILILLCAAGLSIYLHDGADAGIILGIVLVSGLLGFWQEHGAAGAVEKLLAMVQVTAKVLRDGKALAVPSGEVVPGDVITLGAGDRIPGDSLILDSNDLYVNEATLTGETYP